MFYSYRNTDPYSSEYRDYRPSKDHRPTRDHRSSKDYTRSGSRAFDCCAPPPPPPKDYEYDFLPTHGSYIYEANSRRKNYECQCDCCPHTYAGARRVSEGRSQRSSVYEHMPTYDHRGVQSRRRSSLSEPSRDHRYYEREPRSKRSGKSHAMRIVNHTNGALFRDQQPEFHIEFDRNTMTRDVLALLVTDPSRYQVVVHWDDGVKEKLIREHSWRDVRRHAKYLRLEEVKGREPRRAKHVRWADQIY